MIYEIIIFLLLSQLLLGIYLWYWVKDFYKYPNLLGFPIIGNLYHFYRGYGSSSLDVTYRYEKSIAEKYGDGICFTFINGRRALLLSCPHLTEKIAYHPNMGDKAPLYTAVNGAMKGVFSYRYSDGEWKLRRKELNNSLTKNRIETEYYEEFQRITKDMVETIGANAINFDVVYNMTFFTINVFKATFCGIKEITPLNRQIHRRLHILEDLVSFALATPLLGFIFFHVVSFLYGLFLEKSDKLREKAFHAVEKEFNKNEERTTKELSNLPLLLVIAIRNKQRNLKTKHLEREFWEMMVAGTHTVKATMTGALAFLAVLPEIQEKAWKEQFDIFGTDTRDPTVEDVKKMHYLDRFLKETFRFISAPQVAKWTTGEINIDGIIIPAGTLVAILQHKMRMDPKYWKNPRVFDPDRFLEEDNKPKYSYAPFGVGIRSCPGIQYANYELKVALSTVLRRFKLLSTQKFEDLKFKMHMMVQISNLLSLQVEERKYCL